MQRGLIHVFLQHVRAVCFGEVDYVGLQTCPLIGHIGGLCRGVRRESRSRGRNNPGNRIIGNYFLRPRRVGTGDQFVTL
jgi:hypothetical protein